MIHWDFLLTKFTCLSYLGSSVQNRLMINMHTIYFCVCQVYVYTPHIMVITINKSRRPDTILLTLKGFMLIKQYGLKSGYQQSESICSLQYPYQVILYHIHVFNIKVVKNVYLYWLLSQRIWFFYTTEFKVIILQWKYLSIRIVYGSL
ncbi:hypothetical protein HanLR1_Chr10g0349271 [Helianthus annuus]|nr:hypothetical protein HanHA89_Chr10g0371051 [Helianthus annuus]KAJ0695768.1 hypothetical protein HanLR1_Chr10g0349271 [Helianthus annuus]